MSRNNRVSPSMINGRQWANGNGTSAHLARARIENQSLRQRVATLSAEVKRLTLSAGKAAGAGAPMVRLFRASA